MPKPPHALSTLLHLYDPVDTLFTFKSTTAYSKRIRRSAARRGHWLRHQCTQEPQFVQTSPYGILLSGVDEDQPVSKKMRGSTASVEWHHKHDEEGRYMGYELSSISRFGVTDGRQLLGAKRVVVVVLPLLRS